MDFVEINAVVFHLVTLNRIINMQNEAIRRHTCHITDYTTYLIQYPNTDTMTLGAKNYVYLYGN